MNDTITVIGGGLAGCEAAWAIAQAGVNVTLIEMKPQRYTAAHHSPLFAELVCSNSLKAARLESAAGLLKEEMYRMGSVRGATLRTQGGVQIGRNSPCPCGSGKRYKRCCGAGKDED